MLDNFPDKVSRAVLHTVAYSDIFDYPLTAPEVHRYLTGVRASFEEVAQALEEGEYVNHLTRGRRTADYPEGFY